MNKVIKRDGRTVAFDQQKIITAVLNAFKDADKGEISQYAITKAKNIADYIATESEKRSAPLTVEEIQNFVEHGLMSTARKDVARNYISYRDDRTRLRENTIDKAITEIIEGTSAYWNDENSNKNAKIASTQRDYMAGQVSTDISRRQLLPIDVVKAHDEGLIHFHDIDYFAQHIFNCCLVNLEDMLQNGTVINQTLIEKPHSFSTACNIATQAIAVVASGQYGGQSISLAHLAPFVDISRQQIREAVIDEFYSYFEREPEEHEIHDIIEKRLRKEVNRGVQTIQYQINTLNTSNGQTPFVTVYMYLNEAKNQREKDDLAMIIEEVLKQRIQGVKNEVGVYVTPAFPKLIYVLEEDNIHEGDKYWDLTWLAAKCSAKRLVPDYISEKKMLELKGDVYPCMGCRSFLTPDRFTDAGLGNMSRAKNFVEGVHKYYGRFNQGVVTVNLADIALTAKTENRDFWDVFDERMILCHKALRCRHERLLGTISDISPIHWQYGALARLAKGEKIDALLYNGYSTLSLGYCALWECVYAWTGHKLIEPEGHDFGLEVMRKLNEYTNKWKEAENIDYSLYGTPLESSTYKFAKLLKKRFGEIEGITDKDYVTNSYHIHVTQPINAFEKLAFESEFQDLSPGGAISYIEVPNMQHNLDAVLDVIKFIYDNILYAEINTKSDYCQVCGYDGEISIVEKDNGKLDWKCPNCGNMDHSKLNISRRTCGKPLYCRSKMV